MCLCCKLHVYLCNSFMMLAVYTVFSLNCTRMQWFLRPFRQRFCYSHLQFAICNCSHNQVCKYIHTYSYYMYIHAILKHMRKTFITPQAHIWALGFSSLLLLLFLFLLLFFLCVASHVASHNCSSSSLP